MDDGSLLTSVCLPGHWALRWPQLGQRGGKIRGECGKEVKSTCVSKSWQKGEGRKPEGRQGETLLGLLLPRFQRLQGEEEMESRESCPRSQIGFLQCPSNKEKKFLLVYFSLLWTVPFKILLHYWTEPVGPQLQWVTVPIATFLPE